jgi:hypothetical protein
LDTDGLGVSAFDRVSSRHHVTTRLLEAARAARSSEVPPQLPLRHKMRDSGDPIPERRRHSLQRLWGRAGCPCACPPKNTRSSRRRR